MTCQCWTTYLILFAVYMVYLVLMVLWLCPSQSGKVRFFHLYFKHESIKVTNKWLSSITILNLILHTRLYCFYFPGINIFLDGFVPTENMRFRTESLVFKVAESATEEEVRVFIYISNLKYRKNLNRTSLHLIFFFYTDQEDESLWVSWDV